MVDFENKLSKIETEVAAMREKISFFSVIYEKFDRTLDKLEKQHNDELREVHNKIEDLNKWRWLVMGGAVVVGWILSKLGLPFEVK